MLQLNQQDSMFLFSESARMPMHIASLHVYNPSTASKPITFERILDHVRSRLPLARVLRRKIVRVPFDADYPYWVEDDAFDLEFHVRNIGLPAPGNMRTLWRMASRLHSIPLDLDRPPWEIYIIEGLRAPDFPPESLALYIKVHHSAIDGISGIELMGALNDLDPAGRDDPEDSWMPEMTPAPAVLLMRTGVNLLVRPGRFYGRMLRSAPGMRPVRWGARAARNTQTSPITRLNAPATTHRVAGGFRFELATAKRIRSAAPGSTVNDVVLAIVGGGLRRYLQSTGDLPATSLLASVPISMRTEKEAGLPGNMISMMIVSLGTDIADPLERLKVIQQSTAQSKEVGNAVEARTLAESGQLMPGALIGLAARSITASGVRGVTSMLGNICVSNVPGSQVPLYLCGARMESYYGLGPVYDHLGPLHMVVSYMGRLHLSVTTVREVVPDLDDYVAGLESSFDELLAAAEAAGSEAGTTAIRGICARWRRMRCAGWDCGRA
jgi:WS/DGAT/MGAT family acyltransferase